MRSSIRYFAIPLAAVGIAIAADMIVDRQTTEAAWAAELPEPGYGPSDHGDAIAANSADLSLAREKIGHRPGDWLSHAMLANALMDNASLTGDFDAIIDAQTAVDRAAELAPDGSGPFIVRAHTAMGAHRIDVAATALDRYAQRAVPESPDDRAEATAIRGDIAFYLGNIAEAERLYGQADALAASPGIAYRRALAAKAKGDFDAAERLFLGAITRSSNRVPRDVANIAVQLGGIDQARGRYEEAREHFLEADALFPGYWLFEAHIAQADYLTGRTGAAFSRLDAMLETEQPVDVTELYALLLQAEGREQEAARMIAPITAIWGTRLRSLPQAAYGHAIEHHFAFGSTSQALELAERNLALRPYGESRLLMAEAYLANNRPAEALEQIRLARYAGWLSAPQLRAEVNALEALGRDSEADAIRAEAEAINPYVFDPVSELVWFSHG